MAIQVGASNRSIGGYRRHPAQEGLA